MSTEALGIERSATGRWSDLPDDLHGMILSKVGACPRDRVRFAAVCKAWREAVPRHPMPPAAPMLLVSPWTCMGTKHLCGPDKSWVFRVPSKVATNKRFVGSHDGGWIAAFDGQALTVVNLFSGHELALSPQQSLISSIGSPSRYDHTNICKIVFSGDPASTDGCILIALTNGRLYITRCRVGCRQAVWKEHHWSSDLIRDIVFCNGELYGLTYPDEIVIKFGIGMRETDTPVFTTVHWFFIQSREGSPRYNEIHASYIMEVQGKLSMAVMTRWLPNLDPFFKVFKLVGADASLAYSHKWEEVTSFGSYALFIGPTWSKGVHVPVGTERHGFKRNHIYYSIHTSLIANKLSDNVVYSAALNNGDHINMCCKEDQSVGDGVGRTGYYVRNHAMWIYPPDL
ncbi:unnamed protein product [Alopecurus aequalis]